MHATPRAAQSDVVVLEKKSLSDTTGHLPRLSGLSLFFPLGTVGSNECSRVFLKHQHYMGRGMGTRELGAWS